MSSVRRMVPPSAARRSASMPTLSGRRRVSGTAKHFGNFAANTDMTALLRARFFDIRPAPVSWAISTTPHDNHATTQHLNFHQAAGGRLGCAPILPSSGPGENGRQGHTRPCLACRPLAFLRNHCLGCGSRCFHLGLCRARCRRCSRRRSPKAPALTPANWVKPRGLCVMPHFARIVIIALVAASCSAERAQQESERKEIGRQLTAAYYSCVRTSFASMLPTMVDRNSGIDQAFMVCRTEESKLQAFEESLSGNPSVSAVAMAAHRNTLKEELLRR